MCSSPQTTDRIRRGTRKNLCACMCVCVGVVGFVFCVRGRCALILPVAAFLVSLFPCMSPPNCTTSFNYYRYLLSSRLFRAFLAPYHGLYCRSWWTPRILRRVHGSLLEPHVQEISGRNERSSELIKESLQRPHLRAYPWRWIFCHGVRYFYLKLF